jgi:hypothetical protein
VDRFELELEGDQNKKTGAVFLFSFYVTGNINCLGFGAKEKAQPFAFF